MNLLFIREEAHIDAAEAYDYYEKKSPGLDERFLDELVECYRNIAKHPEHYGIIDDRKIIRDVKLRHFPHLVIYEIEEDKIIVYSVFNGYKNPDHKPI